MSTRRLWIALGVVIAALVTPLSRWPIHAQQDCTESTGSLEDRTYHSAILNETMPYSIYTPSCYQTSGRQYPVVYLMHGSDAVDSHYWVRLGLIEALDQGTAAGIIPPMIVVLPFGGWVANQNQFGAVSWANVFLNELMPDVETHFRVDARREMRAIGGISRGGFWAFNIAFLHPDLFSILGGHSPFFHPSHWAGANPLNLVQSVPGIERLRIWMDHGKYDYAAPNIKIMETRLIARDLSHVYLEYPEGSHEGAYWASHVMDYLIFYGAAWLSSDTPTPTPSPTPQARTAPLNTPIPALFPATALKSGRYSLPLSVLQEVAGGGLNPDLILDSAILAQLQAQGITLHPQTRITSSEGVITALETERSGWTLRPLEALSPRFRLLMVDEINPLYGLRAGDIPQYPFLFGQFPAAPPTTILISGVTAMTRRTGDVIDANGTEWASSGLRGITRRADIFHVSNEVSFHVDCPQLIGGRPFGPFCAKDPYFEVLLDWGVDVVELSGNHNLDYQGGAYLRTLERYSAAQIKTVGGGATLEQARQTLTFDTPNGRIGWLSCNWVGPQWALAKDNAPGAAYCDEAWLSVAIPQLKASHEVVIVSIQFTETDSNYPTPRQETAFRQVAEWGADVVIGTQAHLPQIFDLYRAARGEDVLIAYGLGNLIFDQTEDYRYSFLPELILSGGELRAVALYPTLIENQGRPRLMDERTRGLFLGKLLR